MTKKIKHLKAITEIVDGKMVAVASDESIDRSGDSLKVLNWDFKNFKKNPVLQAGHDYRPQYTIGIAKNVKVEGKKVTFEPVFHTITGLAREIKEMFEQGFLKAWSVGFIPSEFNENSNSKNELLEISAVAVPANANALITSKGMDEGQVENEIKGWIEKSCEEGGSCEKSTEEKKTETKSPACRMADETAKECVARKIPEIMKENPKMENEQATAIAFSMCKKSCEEKDEEKDKKVKKEIKVIERWNKQLPKIFDKGFDIENEASRATTFEYKLYTGYLDCQVRHLNLNNFLIPSPMLGSYLAGFKEILGSYKVIDERNFNYYGTEEPMDYEVIRLNSKEEDDFLVKGTRFYEGIENDIKFIVKFEPCFFGLQAQIITKREDRDWNKGLLIKVKEWVKKNNKLRGEAFCLSGEFLDRGKIEWKDIILPKVVKGAVMKGVNQLEKKGKDSVSRGMMFIGNPGTGKTLSGKAMMSNLKDKTFIWVSARDFEKLEYKRTLTLAFDLARQLSPVVLFMEDIDGWLKEGRMMDLLKTELDGIQENKGLITVLTSNNPEEFPDALLDRPGRFHDILEFSLPDKELRGKMISEWYDIKDFTGEEIKKLIYYTEGFSGAHMRELIDFAKMIASDDKVDLKKALFESLDKLTEQRKLIEDIKKNRKEDKEDTLETHKGIKLKEGRVISKKNKEIIVNTIEISKQAVEALEKLLDLTDSETQEVSKPVKIDTPKKVERDGGSKGRQKKLVPKDISSEEIAAQVLRKIAKNSNFALNFINKNKGK